MNIPASFIPKLLVPFALVGGGAGVWYYNLSSKNRVKIEFLRDEGNKKNVETMMDYLTVIDGGENKDIFKDFKSKHDEKKADTNEGKKWINWKTESFHALLKNLNNKFQNDEIMDRENLKKLTEIMKKIGGNNPTATDEEISQVPELFNKFFEQIKGINEVIEKK